MTDRLPDSVFLDTTYAIALVNSEDALHGIALDLAERLQDGRMSIVRSPKPDLRRTPAA
ncbi:MAG: hypothetical protein JNK60_11220 [Acidobacteria bacterium]|nr:hypothetical protein [Acidobacteriota bacterium]